MVWQEEGFATADGFDEGVGRYLGLTAGSIADGVGPSTLVVQPALAVAQLVTDTERSKGKQEPGRDVTEVDPHHRSDREEEPTTHILRHRRFHGVASLDPERLSRDFGRVTQEVVQHLTGLVGAKVEVMIEVSADMPDGFPAATIRTVSENAKTLKFNAHGFVEQ